MKNALLVLDMQKGYYKDFNKKSMDNACIYINMAINLFRKKKFPIIWIQDNGKGGIISGTEDFEIIELLDQDKNDKNISKRYKNSFNKTDLIEYINQNEISTLIITGYSAAYCVLSTYRAAEDYDLRPIILKNALAEYSDGEIEFVEKISEIITINELEKLME
jgi:nicotinamidase-related amidase